MRDKLGTEYLSKYLHLRGYGGMGTAAIGNDNTGVVDNTPSTSTGHIDERFGQKDLGFKACKLRIVLDEQFSALSQGQRCTLGCDLVAGKDQPMRRGVVLGFLLRAKVVSADTPLVPFFP